MYTNFLKRFKEDESGTATIESLLWMPIFFYLFILITDVSFIFYGKAEALRIIQDGNRAYSVGKFEDNQDASGYIEGRLRTFAPGATVTTSTAAGIITTVATLAASDLMAVGSIPGFLGIEIEVTAQHYQEN
jgi:Flp pilus assembly protein TadG